MTLLTSLAFAVGVAVLTFSVIAKLSDWQATTSMWPVTGRARRLAGAPQVAAIEAAAVICAVIPLPVGVRVLAVGLLFVGYTAVALALRGRRCTCFGAAFHTTFTARHAGLCAVVGLAVLAGLAFDQPRPDVLSAVAGAAAALGATAAFVVRWRHTIRRARSALPGRPEAATRVVVLGDHDCPVCTALWEQRIHLKAIAACDVEFRHADCEADRTIAGGRFPVAVGYDANGTAVAGPVWGTLDIRRLLDATNDGTGRTADIDAAGHG